MKETAGDFALRVSEAQSRDVGKAIVRLDRAYIAEMGITFGDYVELEGKSRAAARVLPLTGGDGETGTVQMDGILRKNAGVGIDDKVLLRPAAVKDAESVVLAAAGAEAEDDRTDLMSLLKTQLDGYPVLQGNLIRVRTPGFASREYQVAGTVPEGPVRIHKGCTLRLSTGGSVKKDCRITYEDIGGLEKQIRKIREMIELPLKYPEVFRRLGIEAPKGLLLYGPPGTGKTLIARAVANETDACFIHVNGPEIINKFYGESEAKLREIFESAAKNAPSIIFLDEIDAISPKRENVNGDVEKRVVAQLLALMDGINDRGQVIVIGATNIPNAIDPALRRPGRFDRELEIGIPDQKGRLKILEVHTRQMPLADDVSLVRLSELTHGYVGADLQSLCREAAMSALRGFLVRNELCQHGCPESEIDGLRITMDDFMHSMSEIEPSAIREVFVELPNVSLDEIGGLEEIKERIVQSIVWPEKYGTLYRQFGCRAPRGILFYGAPGTGKTLFARAIASLNQANFISVKGPELLSKWVGESEKGLREIFRKAKQASPCVVFFDEIDSMAPVRGRSGDGGTAERLICQLLTEMDGIEALNDVLILGATNRLDMVDPALLRPGRFDLLLEFKAPDLAGRTEIFRIHLKDKPLDGSVEPGTLARMTEGFTGADIMQLCRNASLHALSDFIARTETDPEFESRKEIRMADFQTFLSSR